jgi:hypothetical protein
MRRGNAGLYRDYLQVCRELVTENAGKAGYRLLRWTGYHLRIRGSDYALRGRAGTERVQE